MTVETRTIGRLEGLLRLYHTGYQSPVIDKTVEKLVSLEVERSRSEMTQLRERLEAYESQYGMTSDNFYRRFRSGELGDAMDYVEWSVFWDMYQSTQRRLEELVG
ncbi:MAG: hypothetical protein GY759_18170 [Chloroflexi bacterium]|nr:hypothetical protein [Chloroflexota bacterium]